MHWNPAQTEKLVLLSSDDSLTIREVAETLGISHKAVVSKRQRLQAKGVLQKREVSHWWDAHTDRLIHLCKTTMMTAGEIAERLGTGRNAVIGKIHRLQRRGLLPAHTPPLKAPPKPRKRKRNKLKKMPEVPKFKLIRMRRIGEPVHSRPCGLFELDDSRCRWPIGEPHTEGFHFCGALTEEGRPYCSSHCRIAYVKTERQLQRERSNTP